ncbi:hypothetical protein D3C75_982660 [compost metagenome]
MEVARSHLNSSLSLPMLLISTVLNRVSNFFRFSGWFSQSSSTPRITLWSMPLKTLFGSLRAITAAIGSSGFVAWVLTCSSYVPSEADTGLGAGK